ncbi:polymorphic toxin-type HINT domain-containing protein [Streptomyces sp. NPDC091278]|uniref:polymorphic toxin-type HINT domain-containing protein n=1 Tax=Streptomyces sp. NPDC091278 TaxID=3155301 RepID=UPI00344CA877
MFSRIPPARRSVRRTVIPALGAALLVGLMPAQSLALPPDPATAETGRESLTAEPLVLESVDVEKPVEGEALEPELGSLKPDAPEDLQQPPAGTTNPPTASAGSISFGSVLSAALRTEGTDTTNDPKPVPNVPVRLGQAEGQPAPTGTWRAEVVDRAKEISSGVDRALTVGALLTVEAPSTGSVPIKVELGYGTFKNLYGADWSSRLRLVQFPECYLTSPQEEACQAYTELETTNDIGAGTVTATVDTAADGVTTPASLSGGTRFSGPAVIPASFSTATPMAAGGDKAVVGAVDSGAGEGGTFKATPLASSGQWSAGGSSGAFTWSYPLAIPPAPAGPAPAVSFGYSSQTVDGKTSVASPQASWIGEGWDYEPGHIERRYRACKDDAKDLVAGKPNNTVHADKTADLCWVSYNAVMSFGGKTVELVRDDKHATDAETAVERYRPQSDDGTRVERHTGATNRDNNGEYWIVTTPDGTDYYFGLNNVAGGHGDTNSVSTVPVFGNHPKEPCYKSTFANSRCDKGQQAWRWGLDKVVDVHGNAMIINWTQEKNHYAVREKRQDPEQYDRFAYPTSIEYGLREGRLTSPSAKVVFDVQQRCLKGASICAPANFDKTGDAGAYRSWWDTPGALNCKGTSDLCPGFPSFWTQMRLNSVTTWAARAALSGLGKVDTYTLHQSFPEDWYDTSPGLWLNSITRVGFAPGDSVGTAQSKEGVAFAAYTVGTNSPLRKRLGDGHLRNLVPRAKHDKRPPFTRPRIGTVSTETGGEIEVEYKGGCSAEPAEDKQSNNELCFPVRWSPDGDEKKPGKAWFNKYVVHTVSETDKVASPFSRPIHTEYEYEGPAWAKAGDEFSPPALRTHSDWRGFGKVAVTKGSSNSQTDGVPQSQSFSEARYFQGVGRQIKDSTGKVLKTADAPQYAGMVAETVTYLDSDQPASKKPKVVSRTLSTPESTQTASRARQAEDGSHVDALVAYRTDTKQTDVIKTVGDGWQAVRTIMSGRDSYGLPADVETAVVKPDDRDGEVLSERSCTETVYAHNESKWLIGLPTSKRTTATPCGEATTKATVAQLKGSVRITYDNGAGLTKGLATSVADIDGTGSSHSVTTTTTYDPLGRIRTLTAPGTGTVETQYTPDDQGGPVTSVKSLRKVGDKVYETTTTYDPGRALPLRETDLNGRVVRTEYDALGRVDKGWSASRSSGSQSPTIDIDYQPLSVGPTDTRPPSVTVKTLKDDGTYARQVTIYDGLLRQIQTQSEAVGPGRIVTDTKYNDHGLVERQTSGYLTKGDPETKPFEVKSDTPVPRHLRTNYDGLGRAVSQTTYHGDTAKFTSRTSYGDDSVTVIPPGSTSPTTTTISDILGRVTQIRHHTAAGQNAPYRSTTYAYDERGNRTSVTDSAGNAWTYGYDTRGRVVTSTDPDTGTTTMQYDSADRPVAVASGKPQKTVYTTYDVLGRVTAEREGTADATPFKEFSYDKDGALGLPYESKRRTAVGDYTNRVTGYDSEYRPTGRETVIPDNKMTKGLSGTYAYSYTYTPTGLPLTATLPAKGGLAAEKVITRYNEDGLPESTSGINWYTSDTSYSAYGEVLRSVSAAQPFRVWTTNFIDDYTGRLQRSVIDGETVSPHRIADVRYSHDTTGLITSTARSTVTKSGVTWDNQCFTYDVMGQLVNAWTSSITPPVLTETEKGGTGCKAAGKSADGKNIVWGHRPDGAASSGPVANAAHQAPLDTEKRPTPAPAGLADTAPADGSVAAGTTGYRQAFTYDWLGNRLGMTEYDLAGGTTKKIDYIHGTAQPHTLVAANSSAAEENSTYTYDTTGATTRRDLPGKTRDQDLTWTIERKLEKSTVGGVETTYVHDADGNRILENSLAGSTLYLGELEITTDAVGLITQASRSYTQPGTPTVVRTAVDRSTTGHGLTTLTNDHLGTANTMVELADDQKVTRRSFKPYGEARGPKPTDWPNRRGYLGVGIDDDTSGLTHLGAREYDPTTGRFLSADPLIDFTDPLQMNGYNYANNSPISLSDPTGLAPDDCAGHGVSCAPNTDGSWDVKKSSDYRKHHGTTASELDDKGDPDYAWNKESAEAGELITGLATKYMSGNKLRTFLDAYQDDLDKILRKSNEVSANDKFSTVANLCWGARARGCPSGMKTELIWAELAKSAEAGAFEGGGRMSGAAISKAAKQKLRESLPCNSFVAGTKVLMADGTTKPIEDVRVGDKVLAGDPKTGETRVETVTAQIRGKGPKQLVRIAVETDTGPGFITATSRHPFWLPEKDEWADASSLHPGERIQTDDGATLRIAGAEHQMAFYAEVYNLTVSDLHTYYVLAGETPVLVHNSNCDVAGRGLWQLTKEGSTKLLKGGPFKTTFYKSASDGTWWTPDVTGHGESAFKVYRETSKGLEWISDADKYGDYMPDKWKGDTGKFIPNSNLRGVKR